MAVPADEQASSSETSVAEKFSQHNPITDTHQTSPVSLVVRARNNTVLEKLRQLVAESASAELVRNEEDSETRPHAPEESSNDRDETCHSAPETGTSSLKFTAQFQDQESAENVENRLQSLLNAEQLDGSVELHYDTLSHPGNVYVRGFPPEVTTSQLEELFGQYGAIVACKIVSSPSTGASKGFGFVNFASGAAARAAISALNGSQFHDCTLYLNRHISKKERIARLRAEKANFKNLYVKAIAPEALEKEVLELFGRFGKIDSYFLPPSESNENELRGYGFVKYESHDEALKAMETLDNTDFHGHRLQISRAQRREERNMHERFHSHQHPHQHLHHHHPGAHGHQHHHHLARGAYQLDFQHGASANFYPGYYPYYDPYTVPANVSAVSSAGAGGVAGPLPGYPLSSVPQLPFQSQYFPRAFKRPGVYPRYPSSGSVQYQDTNLYVNNLPPDVNDEKLTSLFESFGQIISAKVMTEENGESRGFGFVCFAKALQARNALAEMNEKVVDGHKLSISFAQRKEQNSHSHGHNHNNPHNDTEGPSKGSAFASPYRFGGAGASLANSAAVGCFAPYQQQPRAPLNPQLFNATALAAQNVVFRQQHQQQQQQQQIPPHPSANPYLRGPMPYYRGANAPAAGGPIPPGQIPPYGGMYNLSYGGYPEPFNNSYGQYSYSDEAIDSEEEESHSDSSNSNGALESPPNGAGIAPLPQTPYSNLNPVTSMQANNGYYSKYHYDVSKQNGNGYYNQYYLGKPKAGGHYNNNSSNNGNNNRNRSFNKNKNRNSYYGNHVNHHSYSNGNSSTKGPFRTAGDSKTNGNAHETESINSGLFNLISLIASLPESKNDKVNRSEMILSYLVPKFVEEAHTYKQELVADKSDKESNKILMDKIIRLENSDVKNMTLEILEDYREKHLKDTDNKKLKTEYSVPEAEARGPADIESEDDGDAEMKIDLNVIREWENNDKDLNRSIRAIIQNW